MRIYLLVLLASVVGLTAVLLFHGTTDNLDAAVLSAAFHVVSVATTTGYASTDYALWPVFAPVWLMFLGTFVSCAGSTGGGIKMVRMVVLVKQARREMVRAIHPRVVNPVTLGRATGPSDRRRDGLHADLRRDDAGPDHADAAVGPGHRHGVLAVVATVNNIGPGLGQVGPSANFGVLSDFQTWVGSLGMLMGRLELLAVMVLFVPEFWRK